MALSPTLINSLKSLSSQEQFISELKKQGVDLETFFQRKRFREAIVHCENLLYGSMDNTHVQNISWFFDLKYPYATLLNFQHVFPAADFSGLPTMDMPNLSFLSLCVNDIVDISFLSKMFTSRLKWLTLANNKIKDISILSNTDLQNLRSLDISHNPITDYSSLLNINMPNIYYITLTHNSKSKPIIAKLKEKYPSCEIMVPRLSSKLG